MKIAGFLIVIASYGLFSCNQPQNKKEDKQVVTVSILPEKTFIQKIAGDDFKVNVLLPPGTSPGSFTLLPSQLKDIARSEVWFRMGHIGFEYAWKEKIEQANKKMKVVDLSVALNLIKSEEQFSGEPSSSSGVNPHIWMSPMLVKQMAEKITEVVSILNPDKKNVYMDNYLKFVEEIDELNDSIKNALEAYKGKSFILFHPSLSYYAREYDLKQYSLEPGGKQPTPQRMTELVKLARQKNIRVIYIQSDLDREQARVFAEEIGGKIEEMWPLNPEWEENLKEITSQLIENFNAE